MRSDEMLNLADIDKLAEGHAEDHSRHPSAENKMRGDSGQACSLGKKSSGKVVVEGGGFNSFCPPPALLNRRQP